MYDPGQGETVSSLRGQDVAFSLPTGAVQERALRRRLILKAKSPLTLWKPLRIALPSMGMVGTREKEDVTARTCVLLLPLDSGLRRNDEAIQWIPLVGAQPMRTRFRRSYWR